MIPFYLNQVNRQRSSGFVSDFTSIDEDVTLCQQVTTKKHSRDVSCQTDFPIEEEEDEEKDIFHSSPTVSNTFKVSIDGLKLRKFCWKHDDTGFGSPQARPSTPCPDHYNGENIVESKAIFFNINQPYWILPLALYNSIYFFQFITGYICNFIRW